MIHVLINVDRKTAILAGNYQCGDIIVQIDHTELSVDQQEELFKLRSRRLYPNSPDKTKYYDLTGRIYESFFEFEEQTITLNDKDIENIYKQHPFPVIGTTDRESILSLLDSSIHRREYVSTYQDKQNKPLIISSKK